MHVRTFHPQFRLGQPMQPKSLVSAAFFSRFIREFDPDQGARIMNAYISEDLANHFFGMFWDNLMRVRSSEIAEELLELAFSGTGLEA